MAVLTLLVSCACAYGFVQAPASSSQPGSDGRWGDQHDGTYQNPVLPGDFSDLDVIGVGMDFYAVTSTFQYSPGFAILHSRDLVNWSFVSHVIEDLTRIDPQLNWDTMGRAGRGIWAGAIRFHAGRYWVYFGTPDQGIFMSSAARAEGPWTPVKLVLAAAGWDDPCPFWDDDGTGYLVTTHFAKEASDGRAYTIHLFRMEGSGDALVRSSDRIIHQSRGSEANKLGKIHDWYFHYYSEVAPEGRVAMMERARSLDGPWQTRQLLHGNAKVDKEPNQGGLVEVGPGRWYFLSHQGTGDWEGRAGVLLPVTWIDDWPVIGRVGADGIGNMVWGGTLPLPADPLGEGLAVSDDFHGPKLKPAWEWNYQPRPELWSLTERSQVLRLHAIPALRAGDLRTVANVLTQRALRTPESVATVQLELAGMKAGQEAGLMHYAKHVCGLAVRQDAAGSRQIGFAADGAPGEMKALPGARVWLRSTWGVDGVGRFSYSTDGGVFTRIGEPCSAGWAAYRGDRIGIYTMGPNGYIDVDSFSYTVR